MAMRYLGESFDIHGGGEDLIFPHHECEIAQSEAVTHKPFARYWIHNGFVNMGKDKMSKSLGNTLTIRDIVKRHDPEALRLWILGTHYRHLLEWSQERVEEAARALSRLTRLVDDAASLGAPAPAVPSAFAGFAARFAAAMDDDFNTPQALAVLFDFARALSDLRDRGLGTPDARAEFVAGVAELVRLARVLGLLQRRADAAGPPSEVDRLVSERADARARRDFRRSDELRAEIQRLGWLVEDTPGGPRLTRKSG
jgi:cysteinyl-tRNA synthetase